MLLPIYVRKHQQLGNYLSMKLLMLGASIASNSETATIQSASSCHNILPSYAFLHVKASNAFQLTHHDLLQVQATLLQLLFANWIMEQVC